jgi:hypothetical protein
VHLPTGYRGTDAAKSRNTVLSPGPWLRSTASIPVTLLDCFQNMAFLYKADTLHLPRFGGVSTSLLSPFRDRDSYATNSQIPVVFPALWLMSKSQPPRRRDCFQNTSVRKGNTFHVTCSGDARTALLSFASAFRSPRFLRHQQQKPRRIPRFCGSVHEPTIKTPCSISSEQSGICQWCCPHSQHHLIGHFDEKMVCGCGQNQGDQFAVGRADTVDQDFEAHRSFEG